MSEKFSLKDHLFNQSKINQLATELQALHPSFPTEAFRSEVLEAFPRLELKERIDHISHCLKKYLPDDYTQALGLILQALPPALDETLSDNDFGDFIYAPYSAFVATYGCSREYLNLSLQAIKQITQRFSAEYAIRYFINVFPEETMQELQNWTKSSNYHVRRLCSEGTRPKLPWAQKINLAPQAALPLLQQLYCDPTRYVTRSVANHLNDLSKIDAELVLNTLKKWKKEGGQVEKEMEFLSRHALRSLIKQGHQDSLVFLGIGNANNLIINDLKFDKRVKINEALTFSFRLQSQEAKTVLIDYLLYFQNKKGEMTNKKVYKLQKTEIPKGGEVEVQKRHPLRAKMSTRTLYPGAHRVEIQVNGSVLANFDFDLEAE